MTSDTETITLNRLKNFPISFFSVSLGLFGITLAWQKAEEILQFQYSISSILLLISLLITGVISIVYVAKMILHFSDVKKEFRHPIKINFFPIISKLFIIGSIIFLGLNMTVSKYLWWIGVVAQFAFTIIIMSYWIRHDKFEIHHINPSWFIPVVGSIMIPIAGIKHFSAELSWFFFSLGFFWWFILTTLVVNRMIFHKPIPNKLIPTLFILFAPPIIGFISLTKLLGESNPFGNMLYYFGLSLFILIIFQFKLFSKLKFYLSWWAYSFPIAALTIGTLLMFHESGMFFFKILSWVLFILLNLILVLLIIKSIPAIKNKKICIAEED